MSSAILLVNTGTGARRVHLADYLDAEHEEAASEAAHVWIKQLRHARVDGVPLRRQFTVRGDSLWWFAELYLHKRQVILSIFRLLAALDRLVDQERPLELGLVQAEHVARVVIPAYARARNIRYQGPGLFPAVAWRLARLDLRARSLTLAALASRLRPGRRSAQPAAVAIAAFVHRAFWREGSQDADAESYIGPVLTTLEQRMPPGAMRYVGVGPAKNFGARRWWHVLGPEAPGSAVLPIESLAPLAALRDSRQVWRLRHSYRRMLWRSDDIRREAVIAGCDCWPLVREELAGIAWLQWPWSVRAMDEAGAALDALTPGVVLTYAEAGGWGRAIVLEARRRGIPSVGLQHGFIYRHWLNYRHEPDEMERDPEAPADAGFPRPSQTLLFDKYARQHLAAAGRFPPDALTVTGSARLDALVAQVEKLEPDDLATARKTAGASADQPLVLIVTKFKEARHVLPSLMRAAAAHPDVQFAIKAHPAETPDAYGETTAGHSNVRVLPASAPLGPLLKASRVVVTVNSTVALDAAVLGIPSLVIGLPNNLSPFVDAGILAGASTGPGIEAAVGRILYDHEFRQQLEDERGAFLTRFSISADGGAARRAADSVLALMRHGQAAAAEED
jgi:hypothetical protein